MALFKRQRQPKMTTQALLAYDLGESSSSDSDFRIEDHNEEDEFSDISKDDDDDNDDDDDYDDDDDDDDDKGDDNADDDTSSNCSNRSNNHSGLSNRSNEEDDDSTQQLQQLLAADAESSTKNKLAEILNQIETKKPKQMPSTRAICCVCLGDRSDDANEIIECDGCSVTVHEGCYGVSDNASISSTNSTCATEPWFCEACRAGINDPVCELCPNRGGIFKETDVGKWVHLVCALYIRGVAFGEVDQLSSVTLFEMPYSKWGAKVCSLCDNTRYARTGVCIECDAGMCKAYFHVTCAQAAGFLIEGQNEDEALDPYYAHCKVHSDKEMLKKRKRNFHMLRLHLQQQQMSKSLESSETQSRNKRKLSKYQLRYQQQKQLKSNPWVPTQKMSRLLTTSATACKRLLAKAQIMTLDVELLERQEAQIAALQDIRKKWHIPPAFTVEFIAYYLDRISRSKEFKQQLDVLVQNNLSLNKEQDKLRIEYDAHLEQNKLFHSEHEKLLNKINLFHKQINQIYPKTLPNAEALKQEPEKLALPLRLVPTAAALKMGVGFPLTHLAGGGSKLDGNKLLSAQARNLSGPLANVNNDCGICKRCQDQHLMAKCDTCKLYYHLGCLNPPLTRPPKKSKLYGWQCSECDKSDESDTMPQLPKGPRKSRTRFNKDGSIQADGSKRSSLDNSPTSNRTSSPSLKRNTKINENTTEKNDTKRLRLNHNLEGRENSIEKTIQPVEANLSSDEPLLLELTQKVQEQTGSNKSDNKDPLALLQVTDTTNNDLSKSVRKQKRKEKHRNKHNASPNCREKSPNKDHKRKHKKKHHELVSQNNANSEEGSIPKIKIKFKTLPLPGEITPEAQFFYVPADMVRSAEEGSRPTSVETTEDLLPSHTQNQFVDTLAKLKGVKKKNPRKAMQKKSTKTASVTQRRSVSKPTPPQLSKELVAAVTNCCICNQEGASNTMVTCDECRKNYHFICLDPPLKKSPKIRGYSWHCADCDPTDDERN